MTVRHLSGSVVAMRALLPGLAVLVAALIPTAAAAQAPNTAALLHQDVLRGADLWAPQPRILAAGLGFTDIVGVPGLTSSDLAASEAAVRAAGGTWTAAACPSDDLWAFTSASTPQGVQSTFGVPVRNADGLPVEFSWPIRPSTLGATDFRVTLSDGSQVTPLTAAVYPNAEYNERSTAVLFGHFGDRGSVYPVKTEVIADATPLQLVGPGGRPRSAVGLSATAATSPYGPLGSGPRLVAAKLTRLSTVGEGAPRPFSATLPNDGRTLYGPRARYRLRVFTSGGFSPDGVAPVKPTDFARLFELGLKGGRHVTAANRTYHVAGGRLRVLGLADLGRKQDTYDDCYHEDKDNQIDIVLDGDRRAMAQIRTVDIAEGTFYNPGGPGSAPTPGVRYTAGGPAQRQKVTIALDDPRTVSFHRR
jgi:hypothetical protein